jgi:hypothetical protein
VIGGFEQYRAAAADGVRAASAEPILVNEQFPAVADSSRNACLNAVASADALVLAIGERAGWRAPSGRFVIEEEYDEAVRLGIPLYVFVQEGKRDAETERLENKVSDYVLGTFRKSFRTPEELRDAVTKSLTSLRPVKTRMAESAITKALIAKPVQSQSSTLRLVIASLRDEELIDPLKLHDTDFQDEIIQTASAKPYPLLGLRKEKNTTVSNESLTITQSDEHGHHSSRWEAMLTIGQSGVISAETSIGSRTESKSYDFSSTMVVQTSELTKAAQSVFQCVNGVLRLVDEFLRHRQLEFNVAILNLGYRYIVDDAPRGSGGISMRMADNKPVTAFDKPRTITRETLSKPDSEIERVVQMLKNRAK